MNIYLCQGQLHQPIILTSNLIGYNHHKSFRVFLRTNFECCLVLFGTSKITALRVEFNMALCCGSSNLSDESGAESSDIISDADILSEDESVESNDSNG